MFQERGRNRYTALYMRWGGGFAWWDRSRSMTRERGLGRRSQESATVEGENRFGCGLRWWWWWFVMSFVLFLEQDREGWRWGILVFSLKVEVDDET